MKVLVLVDGEHYPSVVRWGLGAAESMGHEVLAALFLGGTEKVAAGGGVPDLGVTTVSAGADRRAGWRRSGRVIAGLRGARRTGLPHSLTVLYQ